MWADSVKTKNVKTKKKKKEPEMIAENIDMETAVDVVIEEQNVEEKDVEMFEEEKQEEKQEEKKEDVPIDAKKDVVRVEMKELKTSLRTSKKAKKVVSFEDEKRKFVEDLENFKEKMDSYSFKKPKDVVC